MKSLGYQLHNLYCAFEDLFEVVAGTFENQIGEEGRYHIELLRRLTVAIEGVRPALLSPECYRLLDNLRAFRHFFGMRIPSSLMRERSGSFSTMR